MLHLKSKISECFMYIKCTHNAFYFLFVGLHFPQHFDLENPKKNHNSWQMLAGHETIALHAVFIKQ